MVRLKKGVREAWAFAALKALGRACEVCGGENDCAAMTTTCPACLVWASSERVDCVIRNLMRRRVAG